METGELAVKTCDLVFEFESNIYSLDTLKRAIYKYSSAGTFDIRSTEVGFRVYFNSLAHMLGEELDQFKMRFHAEIVDQDLREVIKQETEKVRLLILANAFSRTKFID